MALLVPMLVGVERLDAEIEPWSSGYGRRLMIKDCESESQHRILDGHFHIYLL